MQHSLLIVSQSDCLIQVVDWHSHTSHYTSHFSRHAEALFLILMLKLSKDYASIWYTAFIKTCIHWYLGHSKENNMLFSVAATDQRPQPAPVPHPAAPSKPREPLAEHKEWQQVPAQAAPPPVTTQHPLDYIQQQLQQATLQASSQSTAAANQAIPSVTPPSQGLLHPQHIQTVGTKQEAFQPEEFSHSHKEREQREFISSPTKREPRYSPGKYFTS